MMKWWNHQHSDLMQSFHIEVICLEALHGKIEEYPWSVYWLFDQAVELTASPLWHEVSYADDYLDYSKRQEVLKRLRTARDRSHKAWAADLNGSSERAMELWRYMFGSKFPSYG